MSRRRIVFFCGFVAAALGAVQVVACSSFSGASLTEQDGATDAPTTETRQPVDASAEAAPPFCASHPGAGLCADFDTPGDRVDFHFIGSTGDVALDPASFVSPPAAARVRATGVNASLDGEAIDPAFMTTQRLRFATLQGAPGTDAGVTTGAAVSRLTTNGCRFDLESFGDQARIDVLPVDDGGAPYQNIPLTAYPVPNEWSSVEILLEAGPNGVIVTVHINDVIAVDKQTTTCAALDDRPQVSLGLMGISDVPRGEAHYDNALLESK